VSTRASYRALRGQHGSPGFTGRELRVENPAFLHDRARTPSVTEPGLTFTVSGELASYPSEWPKTKDETFAHGN
jgi:hypothetical protein